MGFLEGTKSRPLESAGAPTLGVDEAQSINVSAAPSTGTFVLVFEGFRTTPIAFNANAALTPHRARKATGMRSR